MKLALTATPGTARFGPIVLQGDLCAAFELAADLGYDGVELHLRHPGDVDHVAVAGLATRYGMGIPTLGTGMAAVVDELTLASPDPEVRRGAVNRIREHIALAKCLKSAVTIGAMSGWAGSDTSTRDAGREAAMECLAECCRAAAASGVTILLEPINRYECDYINTVDDGLEIIRRIAAPNLKLLADTFHMNIEERDVAASIRRAGSSLGHFHLVDTNRKAPGYGHLNVRGALCALREIGYQGYLSFEVLPQPTARQAATDAIHFVSGILEDLRA